MYNALNKFKMMEITSEQLKKELGDDLYNVPNVKPQKIYAKDVSFVIEKYLSNEITLPTLLDWVNTVWFTDLYIYNPQEEDTIASVMTVLETLDEYDTSISKEEFSKMLACLNSNTLF